MLGGEGTEEDVQLAFQKVINKLLSIEVKTKDIYPIYDYFHNTRKKLNYVFYAEVGKKKILESEDNPSWFTFGETLKLLLNSQTRQDIVVGERVINAKSRDDEAKRILISI